MDEDTSCVSCILSAVCFGKAFVREQSKTEFLLGNWGISGVKKATSLFISLSSIKSSTAQYDEAQHTVYAQYPPQ